MRDSLLDETDLMTQSLLSIPLQGSIFYMIKGAYTYVENVEQWGNMQDRGTELTHVCITADYILLHLHVHTQKHIQP